MVQICPSCKKQVSDEDAVCPHCGDLLIYEYPKQVAAQRNRVLFPVGLVLLFAAVFYEIFQSRFNDVMHGIFYVAWLTGFAIFCVYVGKGDRDFWWGI